MTKAAAQLSISQPAATGRLRTLEASLRKRLFEREGRRIAPTAAAHELARSIAPYLDGLEAVIATTQKHGGELAGTLHLGGPAEFISARILPALAHVAELGIRLRVRLGLAEELVEALAASDLDIALATVRVRNDAVGYQKFYREDFVLVGAPKWSTRLTDRYDASLGEGTAAIPVLAYAEDLPIVRRYWEEAFGKEPSFQAALVASDLRALIRAAVSGAGITVVPRYLCEAELADCRLMLLHKPSKPPSNDIYLAWCKFALRHPRNVFIRDALLNAARGWTS